MAQPDRLSKKVVQRSLELLGRRPWARTEPNAPILLRLPGVDDPLVAIIAGQRGEEYGLMLLLGPSPLESALDWIEYQGDTPQLRDGERMVVLSFDPAGSLHPEQRALIANAGLQARRDRWVPSVLVTDDGGHRPAGRKDLKILDEVLGALLAADDEVPLAPVPFDRCERRVFRIELDGHGARARVRAGIEDWPRLAPLPSIGDTPSWDPAESELELLEGEGCVDWARVEEVAPDVTSKDRVLTVFAGPEQTPVLSTAARPASATALLRALERGAKRERERGVRPGLPRKLATGDPWLAQALGPILENVGGSVTDLADREARIALHDRVVWAAELVLNPTPPDDPRTIDEWKKVDGFVTGHMRLRHLRLEEDEGIASAALNEYFGDAEFGEDALEEYTDWSVQNAYTCWFVTHFRGTPDGRTVLEHALEDDRVPPAAKQLIEARIGEPVSLYRVLKSEPGSHVTVEDVLSGERHEVHDRAMSECELDGTCVPLRLFGAGEWTFADLCGPPLPPGRVDRAVGHLTALGLEPTRDASQREPHLWGRLWDLVDEWSDAPPHLSNTSGDPLEIVSATFELADPAGWIAASKEAEDLEEDGPGAWTWIEEEPGSEMVRVLARMELFDDKLLVEVNSTERLRQAEARLAEFGEMRLVSRTNRGSPMDLEPTLDDLLPEPELEAGAGEGAHSILREFLLRRYLAWLDEPLPTLDGKTPRQTCTTPTGRQRVAVLIRTIPDVPSPDGPVPAPRERLLRELGLGE